MSPAKRRPDTPASRRPKRATVPDVPTPPPVRSVPDELVTAPVPPAATEDSTELLGPDGELIAQEAPTETGQAAPEDRATTQSPRRSRSLYPLPVWPD